MNLKEIGFPYKHYEGKKLDHALRYIQAQYLDYEILEGTDRYFIAKKEKEPVIDKRALKKDSLTPTSRNYSLQKGKVTLDTHQIDCSSHGFYIDQRIRKDPYENYFIFDETMDYTFEKKCLEQPTTVMEEGHQNEVEMITNQVNGSISLHRQIPLHEKNYIMLRDAIGSSFSSLGAMEYLSNYSNQIPAFYSSLVSLQSTNQIFNDTLPDPLVEASFLEKKEQQNYQLYHPSMLDTLTYYQNLRALLVTKDFGKLSSYLIDYPEQQDDIFREIQYIKRNFPQSPWKNQTLYTRFSTVPYNDQMEYHCTHILVPKGISVPDFVAKRAFGLKNFDVKEQGKKIQENVYQKVNIKK